MYKCIFFVFIIILNVSKIQGQISLPFPDSSGRWSETEVWYGGSGDPTEYIKNTIFINGDTTISGNQYKKVWLFQNCDSAMVYNAGFYRVDNLKVYYRDNLAIYGPMMNMPVALRNFNDSNEILLYDYGLQVGDTFILDTATTLTVSLIDSVLLNSTNYKRINFASNPYPTPYYYWIEGIGSTLGFFPSYYYFENEIFFNCFLENNENFVFNGSCSCFPLGTNEIMQSEKIEISPNPFISEAKIKFASEQKRYLEIVNMIGIKVKSFSSFDSEVILEKGNLKAGIYLLKITDEKNEVYTTKIIIQ